MHFVILVALVVTVCGRDLPNAGYHPAKPHHEPYDSYIPNSPPREVNERRYEELHPHKGNFEDHRPPNFNNRGQINNEDNRGFSDGRNERRHLLSNAVERLNRGVLNIVNEALVRQGNLKRPFPFHQYENPPPGVNERRYGDYAPNRGSYKDHSSNEYNRDFSFDRNGRRHHLPNVDQRHNPDVRVVNPAFDNNKNALKSNMELSIQSKRTIENEVTANPFNGNPIEKGNKTVDEDKWIWDDGGETGIDIATTEATTQAVDDRGLFIINNCPTNTKRVHEKCVVVDKD